MLVTKLSLRTLIGIVIHQWNVPIVSENDKGAVAAVTAVTIARLHGHTQVMSTIIQTVHNSVSILKHPEQMISTLDKGHHPLAWFNLCLINSNLYFFIQQRPV
jgi:hypothetical protein